MVQVFISWSGERSKVVAAGLRQWLPMVIQAVRPWMSETDLHAGDRWATEIGQQLEACQFGILCLTPENLMAPWLLYEAGAIARQCGDASVVPYLIQIDPTDMQGPLAQFQAKRADKEHTRELVRAINLKCTPPLAETAIDRVFEAMWPQLAADLAKVPPAPPEVGPKDEAPARSDGDVSVSAFTLEILSYVAVVGPAAWVTVDEIAEVVCEDGVHEPEHVDHALHDMVARGLVQRRGSAGAETVSLTDAGRNVLEQYGQL